MAVQKCDSRFLVKWCFLSTFHVTSPLRGNNDFVSWFSLQGRWISQSLPMTMYNSDPPCRILHFWNVIIKKTRLQSCYTKPFSCWVPENVHALQDQFFWDDVHGPLYFLLLYKGKDVLVSWPFNFFAVWAFSNIWNSKLKTAMYLSVP